MNYPNPHGPTCPWFNFAQSQGSPNIKWCEETLCQWISEPANTWSNLGYMLVGIYVAYVAYKNNYHSHLKQFGPVIFLMGAASFTYHLSNYYTTQVLDFVGMFLFVGWALGMNCIRLRKLKPQNLMKFYVAITLLGTVLLHLMYLYGLLFQVLILILGIFVFITEILASKQFGRHWKYFVPACVAILAAFTFSSLDHSRVWCHPQDHGWFSQGHAVWHWLGSITMFLIFKHYELLSKKLK